MLSGNVGKYEFLTRKDVLPEKCLLGKTATIKGYENSPLGGELKKQTDVCNNQFKFFKNQINFTMLCQCYFTAEESVKTEEDGIIDNAHHIHIFVLAIKIQKVNCQENL